MKTRIFLASKSSFSGKPDKIRKAAKPQRRKGRDDGRFLNDEGWKLGTIGNRFLFLPSS